MDAPCRGELTDVLNRAWKLRMRNFTREITFAVPGGRKYDTALFSNCQERFLSVSVTGKSCSLLCDHCRGRMLAGMVTATDPEALLAQARRLREKGAHGLLISGGCDREGRVPLDDFIPAIADIKAAGLKVIVHTGLVSASQATELKAAGVDQVLIDIIGDRSTIQQVYHLDKTPEDYYRCLTELLEAGLDVAPHIVIGLHYGKIVGEYAALQEIARMGVKRLVLVALRNLPGTPMADLKQVDWQEVVRLTAEARLLCPETFISFGCARPFGKEKQCLERHLIEAGINAMAYPEEESVAYAKARGLTFSFVEKCCSIL
ncbi:MAG: radical SAM protein [Thermoanaerobacteraceae bacterium]|nr:radical SAM protein [Thermoanaerobacteraceae bacterium]